MKPLVRCGPVAALTLTLIMACGGEGTTSPTVNGRVQFVATNRLLAPVTIAIDEQVTAILLNGKSTSLAAAAGARWLTWRSAKPADSHGVEIPDDIGEVRMGVSGIGNTLEITNVIHDATYVTASVFNETTSQVLIGVFDGTSASCVSVLPGKSGVVHGFTQTGYYRLRAATEMRAYRDGSNCTGDYVAWSKAELAAFEPKSGHVWLTLTTAP